ncbi:reverse transcriptase domain-containing protein [Tanacetum coccineum]
MLSGFFQNQSQPSTSTSMTRAGLSYTPVPPIPPPLYDENEPLTEKETEVTKDKVLPSTKDIQPPVIQKSHDPVKPVGSPISPEPSSAQVNNSSPSKEPSKETRLPYPSRVEYEKKSENDKVQIQKFWEMFKKIHDVLVPVGRLTFPADFVVVDFECDYRVPLILGRPFLRTARVLIDVHGEELVIINQGRVIHSPKVASVSAISHIFPNNNLEDSFKMGDEDLNFIPNKELDKEDLIPIPRESKIGKDCDFPLCDNFQSFKTFSNPLFEKKDDFPSRNDESIFKEEVQKETLKSYSNPLFEDDEEIISIEVSRQISPKVNSEPLIESLPKDDFDNDDDLFEMDSNNDEWKRILYGEDFEKKNFDSDKIKVFDKSSSNVFKSLSDELEPNGSSNVEGNDLDFHIGDASFSTINEDKVFNGYPS